MREAPEHVDAAHVLDLARQTWCGELDGIEHLPVGFGAHHWRASIDDRPTLFITLDAVDDRRDLDGLGRTYSASAALRTGGLEFVHAGLAPYGVGLAGGALSATPWVVGANPARLDVALTAAMLTRLQATPPPDGVAHWRPLVTEDFADILSARLRTRWGQGPFGERARAALRTRITEIASWAERYHRRSVDARRRPWVLTHGEPGVHNQIETADDLLLVDWETLLLAPAERDLQTLIEVAGPGSVHADPAMLEMFDLEWRLDEISQYAAWFEAPHRGNASDDIAIAALETELTRTDRARVS